MPQVRVLRLIEYVGSLEAVTEQLRRSMQDGVHIHAKVTIKIATIDRYPEILEDETTPIAIVEDTALDRFRKLDHLAAIELDDYFSTKTRLAQDIAGDVKEDDGPR
jgi:hypothetical protein